MIPLCVLPAWHRAAVSEWLGKKSETSLQARERKRDVFLQRWETKKKGLKHQGILKES